MELMVVMAILSILFGMITCGLGSAEAHLRDRTQRQADTINQMACGHFELLDAPAAHSGSEMPGRLSGHACRTILPTEKPVEKPRRPMIGG